MRIVLDTTPDEVQVARDESRWSHGFPGASISAKDFVQTDWRAIDSRPCEPLAAADADWGEQDKLANIPRKKQESWVRALALPPGSEGDR